MDNFPWSGTRNYFRGITANGNEENVTVTGNTIYGHNTAAGGDFEVNGGKTSAGIRIYNSDDWTIQNNEIYDNTKGIMVYGTSTSININTGNIIRDNAQGIHIKDDANASINHNNIKDNNVTDWQTDINPYGCKNDNSSVTVDAERNWWGANDGPDDDAGTINGSGDNISLYVDADPWKVDEAWVSSDYSSGGGNDGHTWDIDAFDNLPDAVDNVIANGTIHIVKLTSELTEDVDVEGDLDLESGSSLKVGDYDLYVSGNVNSNGGAYIYTNGEGRLILTTASSVTFTVGTPSLGLCPLVITAPAGNSFAVNLKDYNDVSIAKNFLSQCYWDIDHTSGSDPADLDFVYQKANKPDHFGDPLVTSYVLHGNGAWQPVDNTVSTTDNWDGDTDYYVTSVSGISDFSPYSVSSNPSIPSMTTWAVIIMSGLLAIAGGWVIWRRFL